VHGRCFSACALGGLGQLGLALDRMAPSPCQGRAGKRFFDEAARGDDILVAQAAQTARSRGRRTILVCGGYYDAFQRGPVDRRDFRSLAPALRIEQDSPRRTVHVGGGYRWFTFKSDDNFSLPDHGFLTARQMFPGNLERGEADWEWTAGASLEWRGFRGAGMYNDTCTAESSSPPHRLDRFWVSHVELTRTTTFLLAAGAALHLNQSNSYGEGLVRGVFHARAVVPLPWRCHFPHARTWWRPTTEFLLLPQAAQDRSRRASGQRRRRKPQHFAHRSGRPLGQGFEIGLATSSTAAFRAGLGRLPPQTALLYLAVFDER